MLSPATVGGWFPSETCRRELVKFRWRERTFVEYSRENDISLYISMTYKICRKSWFPEIAQRNFAEPVKVR
jgi:hypothetical protein